MNKLTHYKIPVSPRFLSGHPRAGEKTDFVEKIVNNKSIWGGLESTRLLSQEEFGVKIHTIRKNYPLWKKRMQKVYDGRAVIDLCYWAKPGGRFTPGNELITFATLDKDSGCGVQKIIFKDNFVCAAIETSYAANLVVPASIISVNDGLSLEDLEAWFKGYDLSEPMAIIHFTKFRY
ncbi:MAG: hypothetical protein VB046_09580 [Paludibacter sp.]|nr:hypothetical protein [Paludibacter sp.]